MVQKGTQEDTARLMQAISALSASPEKMAERGRLLDPRLSSQTDLLALLLSEIEETVLRRLIVVQNETGDGLTLEVSERRLMRLWETNSVEADEIVPLLKQENARATVSRLREFCRASKQVFVLSHIPRHAPEQDFGGLAAALLRENVVETADLDCVPQYLRQPIEKLLPIASAIVVSDEQNLHLFKWGMTELIQCLLNASATCGAQDGPAFQVWSFAPDETRHVCRAKQEGSEIWFVLDRGDILACEALFRSVSI